MEDKEKQVKKITPKEEDYSQWYLDIIENADLADNSPVRGCMVIKPNGYAIWENIQGILDKEFKKIGIKNAYFPIFIPQSFFQREAEHIKGFAKECAVVTHHRLVADSKGKLIPGGKLSEPLVVRPTSETIIYSMYSKWIRSFRDLPVKLNQWANVVRWELRTRPFLRTAEFLWQEGHTAHATKKEADEMTFEILNIYEKFFKNYLAIPVVKGKKSEQEKFAGAVYTITIEAMMQDGKALQLATSHMLGQNFSKPFKVRFTDKDGKLKYVWQTSWGLSTRVIGALIMVHSDNKGLILPPKIAPFQVVIVPIWDKKISRQELIEKASQIKAKLCQAKISVCLDEQEGRPGEKFYQWERKGVPLRIEIGIKDIKGKRITLARRDTGEKKGVPLRDFVKEVKATLNDIQENLYQKAVNYSSQLTQEVSNYSQLKSVFENKKAGFVLGFWCGDKKCELKVKKDTLATIRCVLFNKKKNKDIGKCVVCQKPAEKKVIFAKAY